MEFEHCQRYRQAVKIPSCSPVDDSRDVPKHSLTTEQAMRYNRQIVLPNFDLDKQQILLNAKVLVVGVAGLRGGPVVGCSWCG